MNYAQIGPIAVHLPATVETNDQLQALFPDWDLDLIYSKTGIRERRIAASGECASDLGVIAAEKLFAAHDIDRASIDFLLFCTQTPDYPLPTTACLVQQRLGLPTGVGALDFNLGCSGFVYGLSLADGLIRSGAAARVLLITADTYSKYIDANDRSLRTIFSDGAAATLIEAGGSPTLSGFVFGTDGSAADSLMVPSGGARTSEAALKPRKRQRWKSRLYMDGPALVDITLRYIPDMVSSVLDRAHMTKDQLDLLIMHQATLHMLDRLRATLDVPADRMPIVLETVGNTVSSTIPIAMDELRRDGRIRENSRSLLVGFGVGFSWAGCVWTETFLRSSCQDNGHARSSIPTASLGSALT